MRLIDADKLYPDCMSNKGLAITQSQLANAPTVDVIPNKEGYEMYNKGYMSGYERGKEERPQGEWIIVDDTEKFIAKCSICGRIEDSRMVKDYPFCHCGADMRGGRE